MSVAHDDITRLMWPPVCLPKRLDTPALLYSNYINY